MKVAPDYLTIFNATRNSMAFTEFESGRIVDVNDAWVRVIGIARDQARGRSAPDLGLWVDAAERDDCIASLRRDGMVSEREVRLTTRAGTRLFQAWARVLLMAETPYVLWELADVTEARAMQTAILEAESRFRQLVEQSPVAIQVVAPDGVTRMVNRAWETLWGVPFAALAQYNILTDQQLVEKGAMGAVMLALAGGRPPALTIDYDRAGTPQVNGGVGVLSVTTRIYPRMDDAGRVVEIVLLQEDVTIRQELAETRRLAETVFDFVSEAIMVTNQDNRIVAVNPAFCKVTGYRPDQAIGQSPSLLSSGTHAAAFYAAMWDSLRKTDRWSGEIVNRRRDGSLYPEWLTISTVRNTDTAITNYVALFSDITERKTNEERLHRLAHFDYLTGLPNRLLLQERLATAIEDAGAKGHRLAVLFIDLDNFKLINDSLGHGFGDKVLMTVAARLSNGLKAGDTLARYSGDEFVALLPQIRDPGDASIVAHRLLESLDPPFAFGETELHVSCSIGISIFSDDGASIPDLLRNADAAMYRAKKRGRKRIEYFSPELAVLAQTQVRLHTQLRRAIDQDELMLYYQPQVTMPDRRLCGLEALARWNHDGIWISPTEFIPTAENSGLIIDLGNRLLRRTLADIADWHRRGLVVPKVSINISVRQFEQNDFVEILTMMLDESGVTANQIELEVTESVFAEDAKSVQRTIQAISQRGINVAIDDFGTGYSSLSYLKALSISTLKVDQSFVRELPANGSDVAIVIAVISMARALGIQVIAEGVETEDQFSFLAANGCDKAQGYLLGRPMPPERVIDWLTAAAL